MEEWRRIGHWDMSAECEILESSGSGEDRDDPIAPVRVDCDEPIRSATTSQRDAKDAQLSRVARNGMVLVVAHTTLRSQAPTSVVR